MDELRGVSLVRRDGGGDKRNFLGKMVQFGKWFNVKLSRAKGLTLNYLGGNGLILNYLERMV